MKYVSSETIQQSHEEKKPLDLLLTWVPYNISLPLIKMPLPQQQNISTVYIEITYTGEFLNLNHWKYMVEYCGAPAI